MWRHLQDGLATSVVLRSYDTRFRSTQRRPDIYLAYGNESIDIVQGTRECGDAPVVTNLWLKKGGLFLVVTRFLKGEHCAIHPGQFVRIIEHLQELHLRGFVHGDIRGFNTVFSDTPDNCRLIDFDFGGDTATTTIKYPEGYRPALLDGSRVGKGGELIEKCHDWFALAYLLFHLHILVDPVDIDLENRYNAARKKWDALLCDEKETPTDAMIIELKIILTDLTTAGVKCSPLANFRTVLLQNIGRVATQPAATGSPQKLGVP
jgi:hypothetical protein